MKARRLYPMWPTYLDRVVPVLLELVTAVRDEGPDEVRRLVTQARRYAAPAGVDPVEAIVTILAAAVDPEKTGRELFGWSDPLTPGERARPSRAVYRPELVAAVRDGAAEFGVLQGRERGDVVLAWLRAGDSVETVTGRTGQTRWGVVRMAGRAEARQVA